MNKSWKWLLTCLHPWQYEFKTSIDVFGEICVNATKICNFQSIYVTGILLLSEYLLTLISKYKTLFKVLYSMLGLYIGTTFFIVHILSYKHQKCGNWIVYKRFRNTTMQTILNTKLKHAYSFIAPGKNPRDIWSYLHTMGRGIKTASWLYKLSLDSLNDHFTSLPKTSLEKTKQNIFQLYVFSLPS